VDVDCYDVDNGRLKEYRVAFSITARSRRGGVVEISEVGRKAPDQAVAEKYGVLTCVNKLATIGYNLPTYSSC
jgi:hypothetical protein